MKEGYGKLNIGTAQSTPLCVPSASTGLTLGSETFAGGEDAPESSDFSSTAETERETAMLRATPRTTAETILSMALV